MRAERLRFDERGYVVDDDGTRREETEAEFAAHLRARVFPDPTIYRESGQQMALRFAIEAMGRAIGDRYRCLSTEGIECGGVCHLPKEHIGPHLCVGDTDGPGSCEA